MFEITVHDERILSARIISCDTVAEARELAGQMRAAIEPLSGPLVGTADFRGSRVFSQDVTSVLVGILKHDNPKIERSAHIVGVGDGAVFAMQIERLVREAGNSARRVFYDATAAEQYVSDLLKPSQAEWLHRWYEAGVTRESAPVRGGDRRR